MMGADGPTLEKMLSSRKSKWSLMIHMWQVGGCGALCSPALACLDTSQPQLPEPWCRLLRMQELVVYESKCLHSHCVSVVQVCFATTTVFPE